MTASYAQIAATTGMVAAAMGLAAWYLRSVVIERPPIGRFTRADVVIMCAMVVITQFIYAHLPGPAISAVFGFLYFVILQTTLTPLVNGARAAICAGLLVAACIASAIAGNATATTAVNDVMVIGAVVGVSNMWTQTGVTAGNMAGFAAILAVYDFLTTNVYPLTRDVLAKMANLPFTPLLAFPGGGRFATAIGLGDCLIMTVWPLVLAKSYGRRAAWAGAAACLLVLAVLDIGFVTGWFSPRTLVPVLTALGPVIVVQHVVLRRMYGTGRRTYQWRGLPDVKPLGQHAQPHEIAAALAAARGSGIDRDGRWVAWMDGKIVAEGATPGSARRAARHGGHAGIPVVVRATGASSWNRGQPAG